VRRRKTELGRWWLAIFFLILPLEGALAAFDHEHKAWTELLHKHVVVIDGGVASQVRYAGFARDRAALRAYLERLSAVGAPEFEGWSKPQRLAFLINAYNAFTVEKILTRYPDIKSIRDFGILIGNPWKDKFFRLLGTDMSLDNIEHDTIRVPGSYDEPRIHFAVNCASVGCPMLRDEAYTADRLDQQLEDQTRRFLSDRSRNRYEGQSGRLEVSSIFDWYGKDFSRGWKGFHSVEQFLAKYADRLADAPDQQQRIREQKAALKFLDYDWRLNDAKS
jgi:uncharacterized protein DUF547